MWLWWTINEGYPSQNTFRKRHATQAGFVLGILHSVQSDKSSCTYTGWSLPIRERRARNHLHHLRQPQGVVQTYGIYSETNKKSKGVRRDFLCEVSLYLKIRILELKMLFGNDCKYLYSLSEKVHKRFRRFRKNCGKIRGASYISGENLHNCFLRYRYAWSDLTEIIYRKQNDPRISLLWNCCVNFRVLYLPTKWEKTTWNYLYKDKGLIMSFFWSLVKIKL